MITTSKHFFSVGLASVLLLAFSVSVKGAENKTKRVEHPVPVQHVFYFPREIVFWNVAQGDERKNTIFIRQGDDHPVKIKSVKSSNEYVSAEVVKSGGKDRLTYSIDVSLSKTAPVGSVDAAVMIETDHPKQSKLNVPVYWNVLHAMEIDPPAFGVRLTRSQRDVGGVIKIASTDGKPFEIEKLNMLLPNTKTDIKPMKECCGYYVAVMVSDPEYKFSGPQQSSLIVHTDSAQKMVVVPVMVTTPTFSPPPADK